MKQISMSITTLIFIMAATLVQAASTPRLHLFIDSTEVKVGQEIVVDIMVEDVPTVYGADIQLLYDVAVLDVVDNDTNMTGTQLQAGDFLNPAQGFVLQNEVNDEAGTIDYALTLLNPAPPVEGNGRLATVTFKALAATPTTITLSRGLFGTQTGETITPDLDAVQIKIIATNEQSGRPETALTSSQTQNAPTTNTQNSQPHTKRNGSAIMLILTSSVFSLFIYYIVIHRRPKTVG